MQTLILQPQSWLVLGGAQPDWFWRPLSNPRPLAQPEQKLGQKEQLQDG